MRTVIGAALQEAALDPLLTGTRPPPSPGHAARDPALEAKEPRAQELLGRVGLSEAADRKVGGYSGGMKRRLDLALALVHRPTSSSSTSRRPGSTRRAGRRSGTRSLASHVRTG